jgi:tetratricopeptide (TPR) repeat protein
MTALDSSTPVTRRGRRSPRPLAILGATAIILAGSYAVGALRSMSNDTAYAVPSVAPAVNDPIPTPDDSVLGPPVGSFPRIDHSIDAWSKNLTTNPRDFLAATNIAILYQGRGRQSYDLADYQRALVAARTALGIEPTYAPARAAEAAILFTLHDFGGAYAAAERLVRDDPSQVGALATRFDAEVELGRIEDARVDLRRLADVGGAAYLIRQARLRSATGDPTGALASARDARSVAIEDEVTDLGFYDYAVGEYARLAGDADFARTAYKEALGVRGSDVAALVGLARIDAFERDATAAIAGLRRATAIAPQPEALALLGDLQAATDDPAAARTFDTVRFIEQLGDIQATTYDRQLLRFELDHGGAPERLLDRARSSLEGRPDSTGYDTVAWALYRLGRFDDAAAAITSARRLGADDARLQFHDGAIALARGDTALGKTLLRAALELGPALDPVERDEAASLLGS